MGAAGALASRRLRARAGVAFAFLAAATASHGLLDMLTDGGRGVAWLWPLTAERFAAPWRPIAVSPIGLRSIATDYFAHVLRSELAWIWLPAIAAAAAAGALARRVRRGRVIVRP